MDTKIVILVGHLWVTIPTIFALFLGLLIPGIILLEYDLPPELLLIGLIFSLGFAILTYSYLVVKWKIWALTKARNVHELLSIGHKHGLFYPLDNLANKFEIKTKSDKTKLEILYNRFLEPVPQNILLFNATIGIEIKHSRIKNYFLTAFFVFSGLFFVIRDYRNYYNYIILVIGIIIGLVYFKKAISIKSYLKINHKGIYFNNRIISFDSINSFWIEKKFDGIYFMDFLIIKLKDSSEIEINIQDKSYSSSDIEYAIKYYNELNGNK